MISALCYLLYLLLPHLLFCNINDSVIITGFTASRYGDQYSLDITTSPLGVMRFIQLSLNDFEYPQLILSKIEYACVNTTVDIRYYFVHVTSSSCQDYMITLYEQLITSKQFTELNSYGILSALSVIQFQRIHYLKNGYNSFLFSKLHLSNYYLTGSHSHTVIQPWRTTIAILITLTDARGSRISEIVVNSLKNTDRDEHFWSAITLFVGHWDLSPLILDNIQSDIRQKLPHVNIAFINNSNISCSVYSLTCVFDHMTEVTYNLQFEYYILLNDKVAMQTSGWLWNSLYKLIDNHFIHGKGFGTVSLQSDACSSSILDARCVVIHAVPRSHFDIFGFNSKWQHFDCDCCSSQLLDSLQLRLPIYYLMDVYSHQFQSSWSFISLKNSVEIDQDVTTSFPTTTTTNNSLCESYSPDILLKMINNKYFQYVIEDKLLLLSWLKSQSHFSHNISVDSIVSDTRGVFEYYYCNGNSSCSPYVIDSYKNHSQIATHSNAQQNKSSVVFITAIFGNYEKNPPTYMKQNVPCDFICFTDLPFANDSKILGWTIDRTPYHLMGSNSSADACMEINSICNNGSPFNIAKFYKQQFHNIPRLKMYDTVIWIDGNIKIENESTVETIQTIIGHGHSNPILFENVRFGELENEVLLSQAPNSKYNDETIQPIQHVDKQYKEYLSYGYNSHKWNIVQPERPQYGVWVTCFIAYDMRNPNITLFLDFWYFQTLHYSTQDQLGFSYAVYSTEIFPYSLPCWNCADCVDDSRIINITGDSSANTLFKKIPHGK